MSLLYRTYYLDRHGHIERSEVIDADCDVSALQVLNLTANTHGIELWDRARHVGTAGPFDPGLSATDTPLIDA